MAILSEIEEASLSSSPPPTFDRNYDVFLSFRGADTRLGFTNHLHAALMDASLVTFYDDHEIQIGESLKPELENAIKVSRASIIVFSENYASSTWCLDELVLILEQKRDSNQIVIPIFFHVKPTDVRKQQGSFGKAMEEHKAVKMEAEKMELWKKALTEASNLKGMEASDRLERDLIEDIVNDLHGRLVIPSWTTTLPLLIGMEDEIKRITSWLVDGSSHTADILTITGVGGIGKTSLAKYVYKLHCSQFTRSSFVNDVNMRHDQKFHGLLDIQKQLYDDISKGNTTRAHDVSVYTSMIAKTLALKKVLIVLDDINSLEQLDALLGNKGFHQGSKIIITTKDTSLTERSSLFNPRVQTKHTQILLRGLLASKSLELLCLHAFKCQKSKEGYEEVSEELVNYCDAHPLALKVLGGSLHKRHVTYWEECIGGLKKEPNLDVQKLLQMSYDSLPFENDKELFKYIACYFVGANKEITQTILDACDIKTRSGIINLNNRCLLSVERDNKLMMHSLIQAMGRDLVRQESPKKPWERSRLWCHEESFNVLKRSEGMKNVLGLALDMRLLEKDKMELKTNALSKMNNLKLLQLNYVKINGSYKNISRELRWLCMHGFHFKSMPPDLPPMENLVVLDMSYSKIGTFDLSYTISQRVMSTLQGMFGSSSKYKPLLGSLKYLDLSSSELLHSLDGFYHLPALEQLTLSNCISLITIGESIEHCVELLLIDVSKCKKLGKLPRSIHKLKKIKTLLADGCDLGFSIKMRDTDSSAIVEVIPRGPSSFIGSLPTSLVHLSLRNNNLSNESFPMSFSGLYMLKTLDIDYNPIVSTPSCFKNLPRLKRLSMEECWLLETVENLPSSLRRLELWRSRVGRRMKSNTSTWPFGIHGMELRNLLSTLDNVRIDGIIEVQTLEHLQDKVLRSLGGGNFGSIKYQHVLDLERQHKVGLQVWDDEFGIINTCYVGKEMPNWISCRSEGSEVSFTIPPSSPPNKLIGLNLCYVMEKLSIREGVYFGLPRIIIRNITKNLKWIYIPPFLEARAAQESFVFVSHWMFETNVIQQEGDQLTISIATRSKGVVGSIRECGVGFVYDDDEKIQEEDLLGYYKSSYHIPHGYHSPFDRRMGEYVLRNLYFYYKAIISSYHTPLAVTPGGTFFTDKSGIVDFDGDDEMGAHVTASGTRGGKVSAGIINCVTDMEEFSSCTGADDARETPMSRRREAVHIEEPGSPSGDDPPLKRHRSLDCVQF